MHGGDTSGSTGLFEARCGTHARQHEPLVDQRVPVTTYSTMQRCDTGAAAQPAAVPSRGARVYEREAEGRGQQPPAAVLREGDEPSLDHVGNVPAK
jgi:hypothetical protein